MTEENYREALAECRSFIENSRLTEAEDSLELLYRIKPVRLEWYITKAFLLQKQNNIPAAMNTLAKKGWYLYDYPGIEELNRLYIHIVGSRNDLPDLMRHKFALQSFYDSNHFEYQPEYEDFSNRFSRRKSQFLNKGSFPEVIEALWRFYFIFEDFLPFTLLTIFMEQFYRDVRPWRSWATKFPNYGLLFEVLKAECTVPFIIIEEETKDPRDCQILARILKEFQKEVYYLTAPLDYEADELPDIRKTAAVSLANAEIRDGIHYLYPIRLIQNGEAAEDNREYLLNDLMEQELSGQFAVILTGGQLLDGLCCQPILKKKLERLQSFRTPSSEEHMAFGWIGDYLSYISLLHDTDARKLLDAPAECSYSIIVPARNSAATLRYTLKSCLNQRFQGTYEIVLSDNSTPGNAEVYQLYRELNDPRIRYYRTPREYNLSRSFEYAFLHAKGEFLLSIGSDDALLPWTLEVLDDIRRQYPTENIIQWERGFYAWPGFNDGQQHQFVIPREYQKQQYAAGFINCTDYLRTVLDDSGSMYLLPNLYLNSGCRREYLKIMLEKSGRLFDGICQDLYMGVLNVFLNERILYLRYPLTIAGMSTNSMGGKANTLYKATEEETAFLNELKKTGNIGGYCASLYERLMPEVTTDKSSLYNCILRMAARGLLSEEELETIDFRKWFLDVFGQMDIRDPLFDKKIHYFRYTASLHGEDFLQWFDTAIYHTALTPRRIDEEKTKKQRTQKFYQEGRSPEGGQTLDASRYKVTNVSEAALLFEKLTGL